MPCSAHFSETLQTEILSTETSDFLKQLILSHLILCFKGMMKHDGMMRSNGMTGSNGLKGHNGMICSNWIMGHDRIMRSNGTMGVMG